MKVRKSHLIWAVFAFCAALVLAVMAWLTLGVLAAEHSRAKAEVEREAAVVRADLEERTRLALWRMDAAGAAIMLRENRRFFDASPPGTSANDEVLLRFHVRRGGTFEYPPTQDATISREILDERIARFRKLLEKNPLPGGDWELLNAAAITGQANWQALRDEPAPDELQAAPPPSAQRQIDEPRRQVASNAMERARRARVIDQALDVYTDQPPRPAPEASIERLEQPARDLAESPAPILTTSMHAVWLGGELLLLRQITGESTSDRLQGVWIDWRELATRLLSEIPDLLPDARLEPAIGSSGVADPLTLVSFPLRLVREPFAPPVSGIAKLSFGMPLRIAWFAVLTALLASALLVAGIMRLSDRRASFVSAVTHELRTPLTTFRLYSELLERGVVREEKRADYLRVLTREADRLTHLVENVLAFSRIENSGGRSKPRETTPAEMLGEMRCRLEDRLATAGMTLEIDTTTEAASRRLKVDAAVVEHILFNLIDNAAKYAAGAEPAVVRIEIAHAADGRIEILVCDHGPGIPDRERRRIFKPFHKSADAAAETCPGVGLGLALSLRLARSIGGRLECRGEADGACFVLTLPLQ